MCACLQSLVQPHTSYDAFVICVNHTNAQTLAHNHDPGMEDAYWMEDALHMQHIA